MLRELGELFRSFSFLEFYYTECVLELKVMFYNALALFWNTNFGQANYKTCFELL